MPEKKLRLRASSAERREKDDDFVDVVDDDGAHESEGEATEALSAGSRAVATSVRQMLMRFCLDAEIGG